MFGAEEGEPKATCLFTKPAWLQGKDWLPWAVCRKTIHTQPGSWCDERCSSLLLGKGRKLNTICPRSFTAWSRKYLSLGERQNMTNIPQPHTSIQGQDWLPLGGGQKDSALKDFDLKGKALWCYGTYRTFTYHSLFKFMALSHQPLKAEQDTHSSLTVHQYEANTCYIWESTRKSLWVQDFVLNRRKWLFAVEE